MSGPEAQAREIIDAKLAAAGWTVQDVSSINIAAGPGVAVREFALKPGHGTVDYLLYVDAKVLGVVRGQARWSTNDPARGLLDKRTAYPQRCQGSGYRLPRAAHDRTGRDR